MTTVFIMDSATETDGCTDAWIRIDLHALVISQCDSIYSVDKGEIAHRAPQKFKVLWTLHRIVMIYVTPTMYVNSWFTDRRDSRVGTGNWGSANRVHTMSSIVFNHHPLLDTSEQFYKFTVALTHSDRRTIFTECDLCGRPRTSQISGLCRS